MLEMHAAVWLFRTRDEKQEIIPYSNTESLRDLVVSLHSKGSLDDLVEEFVFLLRNDLKQKLESVGKVGRLIGPTLEEFILFGTLEKKNFLATKKKTFSELTRDYFTIEEEELFLKNFAIGPAVDQRPKSAFSFPTGIESAENGREIFSSDRRIPKIFAGFFENEPP